MRPWRIEFTSTGAAHTVGLPETAYKSLTAVLADCLADPWARTRPDDADDPAWRWTPFDDGRGGVSLYLDTDREVLRVYEVVWTG